MLYQIIQEKTHEKHPKDSNGLVPFHYAAQNGYLEVCEFIMEIFEDKNPVSSILGNQIHVLQCIVLS